MSTRLSNLTSYKEKVQIYVPGTTEGNKLIDTEEYVNYIRMELSLMFGGATSIRTKGSYVMDATGELVTENTTIVYAWASKITDDDENKILDMCDKLKRELNQECIGIEIHNQMLFY
jgi:hypothetical protein